MAQKIKMADKSLVLYVTGGTGFVGTALSQAWLARSEKHSVVIQTRRPQDYDDTSRCRYVADYSEVKMPVLALVNLAGAPIADTRWTDKRKRLLETSRIALTESLVSTTKMAPPEVVVSASAIGYYGCNDEAVDESHGPGTGFAASLCDRWERAAAPFAEHSRLVIPRLGVVLGPGGALDKLRPLYRLGLGGPIGGGRQWFSWIHRNDVVRVILAAIDSPSWSGAFNTVAPQAVRQKDFATALGRALKRPACIPTPSLALRVVYGQMAQELLIGGQKVVPSHLEKMGFEFSYPDIDSALAAVLEE